MTSGAQVLHLSHKGKHKTGQDGGLPLKSLLQRVYPLGLESVIEWMSTPVQVRAVRLRRDKIVVALEHKVLMYNFADLRLEHSTETASNPKGLVSLSAAPEHNVVACPGLHCGQVTLLYQSPKARASLPLAASSSSTFDWGVTSVATLGLILDNGPCPNQLIGVPNAAHMWLC